MKLLPSQCKFCGHHQTMHQFTASFYSKLHRVHVCLAVTSWQNDWDLCSATAVTQGWNGHRNKLVQKVYPGEENFPATHAGSQNQEPSITSLSILPLSYPCSPEWYMCGSIPHEYSQRRGVLQSSYTVAVGPHSLHLWPANNTLQSTTCHISLLHTHADSFNIHTTGFFLVCLPSLLWGRDISCTHLLLCL